MREFNGRFWVPRDRRQSRAARQRATAQAEKLFRQTLQAERERQEREASVARKHEAALDSEAEQQKAEREAWERWLGKRPAIGDPLTPQERTTFTALLEDYDFA